MNYSVVSVQHIKIQCKNVFQYAVYTLSHVLNILSGGKVAFLSINDKLRPTQPVR